MSRTLALALGAVILLTAASGCRQLDGLGELRGGTTEKTARTTAPPEMQADANNYQPSISSDGRFVAFRSDATNLVIGPTNGASGIFVKDIGTGSTVRVSTSTEGTHGERDSGNPSISGDGRLVVFDSSSSNLVAGDSNNGCVLPSGLNINCIDVFLKDLQTGETSMVSTDSGGEPGDRESSQPAISADGGFVAFRSAAANLVSGDSNGSVDIFVKDLATGEVLRMSETTSGEEADGESSNASISADGRYVAFSSAAANLASGDFNGKTDVFMKDRLSGGLTLVSADAGGEIGNDGSGFGGLAISADGRFVAFESSASNLVDGDTNEKRDVFVKDMQTGSVFRASAAATGEQGSENSYGSISMSADGRFVAFRSEAPNLVAADTNGRADIFIKDMKTGVVTLASSGPSGVQGSAESNFASISADGFLVAFESASPDMIQGDTNNKKDIFLKYARSGDTRRISTSTSDVL